MCRLTIFCYFNVLLCVLWMFEPNGISRPVNSKLLHFLFVFLVFGDVDVEKWKSPIFESSHMWISAFFLFLLFFSIVMLYD